MLRMLYISAISDGVSGEQLQSILGTAQKNNTANSLTGVLISGGKIFMQILEGPEQAVLRTYVKILDDRRHRDCRLIYISPVSNRLFSRWSMGSIEGKPLEFQHVTQLAAQRRETVEPAEFTAVLNGFLQRLNAGG